MRTYRHAEPAFPERVPVMGDGDAVKGLAGEPEHFGGVVPAGAQGNETLVRAQQRARVPRPEHPTAAAVRVPYLPPRRG